MVGSSETQVFVFLALSGSLYFLIHFRFRELIRQKAVICLYRFQLLAPELLAHVHSDLERALFDKDPGVMAAAIYIVDHNIQVFTIIYW